jgi:hypothetical protein
MFVYWRFWVKITVPVCRYTEQSDSRYLDSAQEWSASKFGVSENLWLQLKIRQSLQRTWLDHSGLYDHPSLETTEVIADQLIQLKSPQLQPLYPCTRKAAVKCLFLRQVSIVHVERSYQSNSPSVSVPLSLGQLQFSLPSYHSASSHQSARTF